MNILYSIFISPIELFIETAYTFLNTVVRYNPVFPVFGISVLVTLCCLPLYAKAESVQEKERTLQKKMKNRISSIKKHFKGDERYMILSMYYRENHYHPLMSLRNSLSFLIQIPFFIAAYHFLSQVDTLKGASFLFIHDLGSPDSSLSIGSISINVLPIFMTMINIISGYIYARDHDFREKLQLLIMALVFLVVLYNSPAALVLYWTFNNIFSLVKNIVYKAKYPKLILYIMILFALACSCIFVIFFRSQGKTGGFLFKTAAVVSAVIISAYPLYTRFYNYIGKKYFSGLKNRFSEIKTVFFLSVLCIWILCALIIPFNTISSDTAAFSFLGNNPSPFSLVVMPLFISFGLFVFWPGCIFLIFPQKAKVFLAFFFCFFLFVGICDTFVFGPNYGTLTESLTFTSDPSFKHSGLSLLLFCIVIILLGTVLSVLFKTGKIKVVSSLLSIVLTGGLLITVWKGIVIQKEFQNYSRIKSSNENVPSLHMEGATPAQNRPGYGETMEPIIKLSKTGRNVVVIMLDRAIGSYFPLICNEKPELNTFFSGFTYYPNTISFFRSTILGAPPIFGGYEYTPEGFHRRNEASMKNKNNEALLLLPTLFTENDYAVSVFDLPYVNYESEMDASFFLEKGIYAEALSRKYHNTFVAELGDNAPITTRNYDLLLKRNFVFFSIFTVIPPPLRKILYKNGSYWASIGVEREDVIGGHVISDYAALHYLPKLTSFDEQKNTLTLMVNNITHDPGFLQYPDYTVVSQITDFGPNQFNGSGTSHKHYHVNAAAYLLLANWFNALRLNGVYDNTKIIIVSDHDELLVKPLFSDELNRINTFYNPILLVKDFNASGDIKTDMTFMTTADVPSIAADSIISNPYNPFTGKPLVQEKSGGVNIYLGGSAYTRDYPGWEALEKTSQFYHVKDNIFDEKNWTKITKQY
jgi:YidC/Oxa1 family membrane protein insertase